MKNETDKIIDLLTKHICHNLLEIKSIGLFNGKMGVCQYLFILARYTKEKKYQVLAESLIDDICRTLSISDGISFVNGLPGVLFGLSNLVNDNYIQTDLDDFSKEIDDYIFRVTIQDTNNLENSPQLLWRLLYHTRRIEKENSMKKESMQFNKALIINIINTLDTFNYNNGYSVFKEETPYFSITEYKLPLYLYILAELYKLNFYKDKLDRIIEYGITPIFNGLFPILQINRISLLSAIYHLFSVRPVFAWKRHIEILEDSIDLDIIFNEEFKAKSLNLNNGVSGLLFVLCIIPETKLFKFRDKLCQIAVKRIEKSLYLQEIILDNHNSDISFLSGSCGIALSLLLYKMSTN